MSENPWIFFGAHGGPGHRLHIPGPWCLETSRRYYSMSYWDGQLCHGGTSERVARLTRLPRIGYSALAFWDYSVDRRGGSNSIIFAPDTSLTAEEIVEGAEIHLGTYRHHWVGLDLTQAQEAVTITRSPRDRV